MLELSIPQPGENSKHVKDLIITLLAQEHPLSIIQLTNKIQRQYALGVTYQAVRKAVNTLHAQNVLHKKGKQYSISKEWVLRLKSFFDTLLTTYETKTPLKLFNTEFAKDDYAVYTFNNMFDLDNFWGDMLLHLAEHLKSHESRTFIGYGHYGWWFLINLGKETKVFQQIMKKRIKSSFLFLEDVPLNHWGARLYADIGMKVKIKEDKKIDSHVAVNIIGDIVIQIKYPRELIKRLKKIYRTYSEVKDIGLKEITQLAHEPHDIKFIMFRNPTIAAKLRESYKF